jgi:hypothetical protein
MKASIISTTLALTSVSAHPPQTIFPRDISNTGDTREWIAPGPDDCRRLLTSNSFPRNANTSRFEVHAL